MTSGNIEKGWVIASPPQIYCQSKLKIDDLDHPWERCNESDDSTSADSFTAPTRHKRYSCCLVAEQRTRPTAHPRFTGSKLLDNKGSQLSRWIRFSVFSCYRFLFSAVFLGNLVAVAIVLAKKQNGSVLPYNYLATAVSSNLMTSILMRQELVINALYTAFLKTPRWLPRSIRCICARVYHYGGIHSGCGIAATVWFTLLNYSIVTDWVFAHPPSIRDFPAVLVLTIILNVILLGIVAMAHPVVRAYYHDGFEQIHRFAGWIALSLFGAHVVAMTDFERHVNGKNQDLAFCVVNSPSFWLLILSIIMVTSPWVRLKRVKVHSEILSSHAARIHFTYTTPRYCSTVRITDKPLKEWHSFAGVPDSTGIGFSVIVSNAGDWTRWIINNPPGRLWIRGVPTRGVLAVADLFSPVLLVCTGSGIGPVLSYVTAHQRRCRILWSASAPEKTYGQGVMDDVYMADRRACIIDTKLIGRPNLVRLAYELYSESKAEAVFAISNPKVTKSLRYGLKSQGVPFFAPIFDS
ncbi:MAG: hypothetical protein Q9227_004660 [Pyrenula ochraceoflavens]